MKAFMDKNMVDCSECLFGVNGDSSCGVGRTSKKPGMYGCNKGRALKARTATPLQQYKQEQLAMDIAGRRA